MALKSTPKPLPTRSVTPMAFETPAMDRPVSGETPPPVTLVHKNISRKFNVFIEQEGVLSPNQNKARFSFIVVDEKKSDKTLHRTFENAAIEIYSNTKEIDAAISFDVARLIQTTKYEITIGEKGESTAKLISSDPGKLRSVLRLIESSLFLINTPLPKNTLPINESWESNTSEFNTTRTLVGQTSDTAIVRQIIRHADVPKDVSAKVSGSGMTIINKTDGGLKTGGLTLQSVVDLKETKHVSSTTIVLKAIQ